MLAATISIAWGAFWGAFVGTLCALVIFHLLRRP